MEGTRPVLVEIQALVAPSSLGTPRRAVVGWDASRLAMVLAVLEAHCGVRLGDCDVYLNVAGGYRIAEPAADLAVAAALVSSRTGRALPADCVYFGEISLSGAVRPVAHAPARLKEARKARVFGSAVVPVPGREAAAGDAGSRSSPIWSRDRRARDAAALARLDSADPRRLPTGSRKRHRSTRPSPDAAEPTPSRRNCARQDVGCGYGRSSAAREWARTTCRLRCSTELSSSSS